MFTVLIFWNGIIFWNGKCDKVVKLLLDDLSFEMESISIGWWNLPEDENNGSDNFNSESHEVSPANDLKDREGNTDEDKKAEFDLNILL